MMIIPPGRGIESIMGRVANLYMVIVEDHSKEVRFGQRPEEVRA